MQFTHDGEDYTVAYTSDTITPNTSSSTRGVVQVNIPENEEDITVTLQAKVTQDAPWFNIKEYADDTIEEIVLAPRFRVITTGAALVWLVETR